MSPDSGWPATAAGASAMSGPAAAVIIIMATSTDTSLSTDITRYSRDAKCALRDRSCTMAPNAEKLITANAR